MKRYGDAEAVSGLLNLVRLELGMSPDTHFTQASCAVLCCAVLCCAVLCCAGLGCAVLCCAVACASPFQLNAQLPLTAVCLP